ncbi:MAG: hypothetical protein SFY32_15215 [Bacteroidota bacterium]|nr:hypothetical protein [Bacteroidota bacterium]
MISSLIMENSNSTTIYGTAGGTLLSIFGTLQSGDIVKTVCLALIGATTSFLLSMILKWIHKKISLSIK